MRSQSLLRLAAALATCLAPALVFGQTGVSDDRVSLPNGPGSLEGVGDNVSVDPNMGLMRYQVSIDAPKGFPGLSPDLALAYSSGSGSGLVGIGWSLSVPSIERMQSKGVPRYTADDLFAADGSTELVPVADGAAGSKVYRARFEGGFVRYTWTDTGAEGFWKAEYPDGRVGYFGADAQGQPVATARAGDAGLGTFRYHLVDVVDPFGNRLHYDYDDFDGDVPLPTAISYAYVGDTPTYVVRLDYEQRPDLISDAGAGYESILRYRLGGARVFSGAELVREYRLDYEDDTTSGGASRLRTVRIYGAGGMAGGQLHPVQFSFQYSRALGADCAQDDRDCARPYLVDMGVLQGAVNLAGGNATLIDINGDGLPDVLDTTDAGAHKFFYNTLTPMADGSFQHGFSAPHESAVASGDTFRLSAHNVQTLDLNGDGYADLVNTNTGAFLLNDGRHGDWAMAGQGLDTAQMPSFSGDAFTQLRFMDADNDKRIDVIQSSSNETRIFFNDGAHFTAQLVDPIGVGFDTANLQLADMNGDGLNDPVEVVPGGSVRYRLNLGRGHWSDWRVIPGLDVPPSEQPLVDLEDLNGDGLSDVVVVTTTEVKYALNRNADRFDPFVTISGDQVQGGLPERADGVTVQYEDMNANGSQDVVWFDPNGRVRYLELFPVRPHLISRIENNLGQVQKITYGTSVEHAARAAAAGQPWSVALPNPMVLVDKIDTFATLTGADDGSGVHQIDEYDYRDGYYDGQEKQFRGFDDVRTHLVGDDHQEDGVTDLTYDNGRQDAYHNGLLISRAITSAGRPISTTTYTFEDCPVEGVPTPADMMSRGLPPVRHVCQTDVRTLLQEGAPEAQWVTTETQSTYDGYGNVTREAELGVVQRGGQDCGHDCEGDERYTETTFAAPASAWITDLPVTRSTYARPDDAFRSDERFYYDGDAFAGLPAGQFTHGFLSRHTAKVRSDADTTIDVERQRPDAHGQVAEEIDPNGDPANADEHRREFTYDDAGLLLTSIAAHVKDPAGQAYTLNRTFRYDPRFQSLAEASDDVVYRNGQPASPVNTTRYRYDPFGYVSDVREMGDADDAPTEALTYDWGDPVTQLVETRRFGGQAGASVVYRCFDGRGRAYQERTQVAAGKFQVNGFSVFNARGAVIRQYQPYVSQSADCDTAPPQGVLATDYRFDATGRAVQVTLPDGSLHDGTASTTRTEYGPLTTTLFDAEDADPQSPHHDTPTVRYADGLGRPVAIERTIGMMAARWTLAYDGLGNLATVTDPAGQVRTQTFDLLGRAASVSASDRGQVSFQYDAAGDVVTRTDARGAVERRSYDGLNRLTARWQDDDPDHTRVESRYDADPDCPAEVCTNTAGKLASVRFPVGVAGFDGGQDRFGYDARGRQVTQVRAIGSVSMAFARTFDANDRLVGEHMPDGTDLAFQLDGAGRLTGLAGFFTAITWDDRGQLAGVQYANGVQEARTYDPLRRLATLTVNDAAGTPILGLTYTRDREGNLRGIADAASSRPGASSRALTVTDDDWYRPTQVVYGAGTDGEETLDTTFGVLDEVLSRTSTKADGRARVGDLSYDAQHKTRVTQAGDVAFTYDEAGHVTKRGAQNLQWDALGRLEGADGFAAAYDQEDDPAAVLDDGSLVLYGPDGFEVRDGVAYVYVVVDGQRAARKVDPSFQTQVYPDIAPGDDARGWTAAPDGKITAADAWVAWAQSQQVLPAPATPADVDLMLTAAARRVLVENEDAKAFLHRDHLGSLVAATDEGGEVRGQRDFYPYGDVRWETGAVDPHGYTGQERMASTDLIHFRRRQLDPWSGRWMSADPAFEVLGPGQVVGGNEATSGYAYVDDDPLGATDPLGLKNKKNKGKHKEKGEKRNHEARENPTYNFDRSGIPGTEHLGPHRNDTQIGGDDDPIAQKYRARAKVDEQVEKRERRRVNNNNTRIGKKIFPNARGNREGHAIGGIIGGILGAGALGTVGYFAFAAPKSSSNNNNDNSNSTNPGNLFNPGGGGSSSKNSSNNNNSGSDSGGNDSSGAGGN